MKHTLWNGTQPKSHVRGSKSILYPSSVLSQIGTLVKLNQRVLVVGHLRFSESNFDKNLYCKLKSRFTSHVYHLLIS